MESQIKIFTPNIHKMDSVSDPKPIPKEKPKPTPLSMKPRKESKSVLMSMRAVCDKLFSKWIKVRDCENGTFICITCPKKLDYKLAECGHFIKRGENAVRFDERNSHAQCHTCNSDQKSNGFQIKHGIAINKLYGKGTADELKNLSKQPFKLQRIELEKLIEKFKN